MAGGPRLGLMAPLVPKGLILMHFLFTAGLLLAKCAGYLPQIIDFAGGTMKAMSYRGPYKVRIEEKDIPAIEHPNDAIVRVELAAICGSDLHLYHGLMPEPGSATPSDTSSSVLWNKWVRPWRTSSRATG